MPSWKVHEKYAKKAGISDKVAKAIDHIIDAEWIHDFGGREFVGKLIYYTVEKIYPTYGVEGVKASLLHHLLDYMQWWRKRAPELTFARGLDILDKIESFSVWRLDNDALTIVLGSLREGEADTFKTMYTLGYEFKRMVKELREFINQLPTDELPHQGAEPRRQS
jgi:hypothetical protein